MRSNTFIALCLLACTSLADEATLYNPKPLEGDVVLPMPNGAQLVLLAVSVPGKAFWSDPARVVQIGDASAGPFEGLQRTQISGSFPDPTGTHWQYYLGKYEFTKGQFIAVLGLERFLQLSGDASDHRLASLEGHERDEVLKMPVAYVSYQAIQEFLNRYNQWLFESSNPERLTNMPRISGVPGFVRLPTEQEWEYAARGGQVTIESGTFDQRLPFSPRRLKKYAWTLNNAKHKVRPIGLREPNPLGFHDLYGNVQELASGIFQPEIGQGKPGGIPYGANIRTNCMILLSINITDNLFVQ